jgi:hypothetical protein
LLGLYGVWHFHDEVPLLPVGLDVFCELHPSHSLCCMLNHGNTLVHLLYRPSSSFCRLESVLPPTTQLLLSQCLQGNLVRHHLQLSNEFLDPVVNHFTQQTLPIINRKRFFMNIFCIGSFCPKNHTAERCSSVVYPQGW